MTPAEQSQAMANLTRAIQELATARDTAALTQVLQQNRGLLHPGMDAVLTQLIQSAWGRGESDTAAIFLGCRSFLSRCRAHGVAAALIWQHALPIASINPLAQILLLPHAPAAYARRAELAALALKEVRRDSEPDLWATLHRERADGLVQSDGPGRAGRIEEALGHYDQALEVWSAAPYAGTQQWAGALRGRAAALRRRAGGDAAQNLREALGLYEQALDACSPEQAPLEWAEIRHGMGATWLEMPTGDKAANIDAAIAHYRAALQVRTRDKHPDLWADTTHDLAIACAQHPGRARAAHVEQAIALLQDVLKVREPGSRPWVRCQVALGNAYVSRPSGSPTENYGRAVYHFEQALKDLDAEEWPAGWAEASYALATAYWLHPAGDRADNLARAATHYDRALTVYTLDDYPIQWAQTQTSLGNIYCQPEMGPPSERLERAIGHFEDALRVRGRAADPAGWATVQNNLGNAYAERVRGNRADNQERAIACYQQALLERTREGAPGPWAETMNNLGAIYSERLRGDRARNHADAVAYFEQALKVHRPDLAPQPARRAARNLAQLAFAAGDWDTAARYYATAIEATEQLYAASAARSWRQVELAAAQDLFASRAYALAKLGRLADAVECLESGRTRALVEGLDLQRMAEAALAPEERARRREIVGRIAALEAELERSADRPFPIVADELVAARAELAAVRAEADEQPKPFGLDKIGQTAGAARPLAYLVATTHGSLALLVDRAAGADAVTVTRVWIAGFTSSDLASLLVAHDDGGQTTGYLPAQLGDGSWLERELDTLLLALGERLMVHVADQLRELGAAGVTLIPGGRLSLLPLHAARYRRGVQEVCFLEELSVAYAPSAHVLAEAQLSCRRRTADLRLAGVGNPLPPIEALEQLRDRLRAEVAALPGEPGLARDREGLARWLDRPVATSIHEGMMLRALVGKLPEHLRQPLRELAGQWPLSLPRARAELESVVELLPPDSARALYEQSATREMLLHALADATVVHLACHGRFEAEQPSSSGLLLADGRLALRDILSPGFRALARARLVVLSACQTAITDFQTLPDEAIGLPGGFLQAGTPAVIGTLWSVDDSSTALLMTRCYELMRGQEPQAPIEALRRAQLWLRDQTHASLKAYLNHHRALAEAPAQDTPHMPLALVLQLRTALAMRASHPRPYAAPYFWAPFTFHGSAEVCL